MIGNKLSLDKGHLLTSVLWNMVPVYSAMVEDLKSGDFGTKHYKISLNDDSVQLLQTPHISEADWSTLMGLRQDIIDGKIAVEQVSDAQQVRAMMSTVEAE